MLTGAEVQGHILRKIEEDPEFRDRLLADPQGVIEAETGMRLPDDAVVFVQESIDKAQQGTAVAELPLTENELAQLTGGLSMWECFDPSPENYHRCANRQWDMPGDGHPR